MATQEGSDGPKTCVVTGATSGIGAAAALELARQGAHVILVGRDPARSASVVQSIRATTGNAAVESFVADLSSMAEVRRLASELKDHVPRIDVLANNAGAYFARRHETPEGLELTFALNVLAPFLLTNLLLDKLSESAPARVINTSSAAHLRARLDLEDLQAHRRYRGFRAYGRSKLALQLITYEFARRTQGDGVTINAYHPGFVSSHFGWNNGAVYRGAIRFLSRAFGVSSEEGADTLVYLATSPDVATTTGRYFYKRRETRSSEASYDTVSARKLWDLCARETGIGT